MDDTKNIVVTNLNKVLERDKKLDSMVKNSQMLSFESYQVKS